MYRPIAKYLISTYFITFLNSKLRNFTYRPLEIRLLLWPPGSYTLVDRQFCFAWCVMFLRLHISFRLLISEVAIGRSSFVIKLCYMFDTTVTKIYKRGSEILRSIRPKIWRPKNIRNSVRFYATILDKFATWSRKIYLRDARRCTCKLENAINVLVHKRRKIGPEFWPTHPIVNCCCDSISALSGVQKLNLEGAATASPNRPRNSVVNSEYMYRVRL